jgi:hypothetical protein
MSENGEIDGQRPPHQTPPGRYPVSLELCYKATSNRGLVLGFGQTRMMSSQDITFTPGHGLEQGMNAEIVVAWPPLLDNRIFMELVLKVSITDCQDGGVEAHIVRYVFRTAPPGNHLDKLHCTS